MNTHSDLPVTFNNIQWSPYFTRLLCRTNQTQPTVEIWAQLATIRALRALMTGRRFAACSAFRCGYIRLYHRYTHDPSFLVLGRHDQMLSIF